VNNKCCGDNNEGDADYHDGSLNVKEKESNESHAQESTKIRDYNNMMAVGK
jgi:hypothetical protein